MWATATTAYVGGVAILFRITNDPLLSGRVPHECAFRNHSEVVYIVRVRVGKFNVIIDDLYDKSDVFGPRM